VGQAIIEIAGTGRVEIEAAIPASFALQVTEGQRLTFTAEGTGSKTSVTISGISPVIDPVSQLVNLRARIAQDSARIVPGMTGHMGPAQ